jgi:hypothetical protein
MHDFAWPLAVVVIAFAALIGFRKSFSKILQGVKLSKAPGFQFEQAPQQQIEEAKIDAKLAPANPAQGQKETTDPILLPKIRAIREDLDTRTKDPEEREKFLLHGVALWLTKS